MQGNRKWHPETLRPGRGEGKGKFAYIFQIHQSFNQEIQERGVLDEFGRPIPLYTLLYIIKLPNGAVYIKNHAMRTATGYSKSSINGYLAKLGLVTCDTKVYRKDLCERLAVPESTFAELRHWSLHITKELAERMSQPPQADSTGEDTQQSQVFGSPGSPVDMWPGPPEHAVRACPVHSPIDFGFMAGARPAADGPMYDPRRYAAAATGEDTQQSQVFGSPGSPVDMWPGPPEHAVRAYQEYPPTNFGFMAGARPAADGPAYDPRRYAAAATDEDTQQRLVFGSPGSPVDMWPGPPEHAVRAYQEYPPTNFGFPAGARPAADGPGYDPRTLYGQAPVPFVQPGVPPTNFGFLPDAGPAADGPQGMTHVPNIGSYLNLYQWT
ncbi:MAG: hypothetical protein LBJ95_01455 [Oscillospiraceae bacterium]|nr:hypothetical protein [Oscillospiraceae bacterium]